MTNQSPRPREGKERSNINTKPKTERPNVAPKAESPEICIKSAPSVEVDDGQITINGHFEFCITSHGAHDESLTPISHVCFGWNVTALRQVVNKNIDREQFYKEIGEQLKRDFINFLKKQENHGHN